MQAHTHRAPSLILSLALVLRTPCSDSLFLVWGERCGVLRGREKDGGGAERKYTHTQARRVIKQMLDLFWQLSDVWVNISALAVIRPTFISERELFTEQQKNLFSHEYSYTFNF